MYQSEGWAAATPIERAQCATHVCAVVVTYHPDLTRLAQVLRRLRDEADSAVLIDNGSPALGEETLRAVFPGLFVEHLHANRGLAFAQNRGIVRAREAGASHVLLLDQDSVPERGMTRALLRGLRTLENRGVKVACVGPRIKLPGSAEPNPFRNVGWLGTRTVRRTAGEATAECDFLIASGTLVPLPVLEEVGGMEEGLFIDQVDTEWCCRARRVGYRVFGVWDAVLDHRVGESVSWIWLGRWRRLFAQKPVRYYYIFRNTLVLVRRRYFEARLVPFHLAWLTAMLVVFGLFGRPPKGLGMMLRGIAHGLIGRSGRLEPEDESLKPRTSRSVAASRQDSGHG